MYHVKFLAAMMLAVLSLSPSAAKAFNPGVCYIVQDADERNYCLARDRRQVTMCYAIQRPDLRAECIAELRGRRNVYGDARD